MSGVELRRESTRERKRRKWLYRQQPNIVQSMNSKICVYVAHRKEWCAGLWCWVNKNALVYFLFLSRIKIYKGKNIKAATKCNNV